LFCQVTFKQIASLQNDSFEQCETICKISQLSKHLQMVYFLRMKSTSVRVSGAVDWARATIAGGVGSDPYRVMPKTWKVVLPPVQSPARVDGWVQHRLPTNAAFTTKVAGQAEMDGAYQSWLRRK